MLNKSKPKYFPRINPLGSKKLKKQQQKSKKAMGKLIKSAVFCFMFMMIELVGG